MLVLDDTIAAIATAMQPAQRGIVRVSGTPLLDVLRPVVSLDPATSLALVRRASVLPCRLKLDSDGRTIDAQLYLWPGRRSYTRQPTAELHMIGSPPLLQMVLSNVCEAGARLANPGEFTLRAFLSGRIDLAQAEAVLGAIDAHDDAEFQDSLRQLAGGLSSRINGLRTDLLDLCADLEAGLDFVEEDIEFVSFEQLDQRLSAVTAQIDTLLAQIDQRQVERDAPRVVVCGAPNAGKSTLFNALSGKRAALTSAEVGTTRDSLTTLFSLGNQRIELIDTAGIAEQAVSNVDAIAQQRARELLQHAQLIILCLDQSRPLTAFDTRLLDITARLPRLIVLTKSDLEHRAQLPDVQQAAHTSAVTGQGISHLKACIVDQLAARSSPDLVKSTAVRSADSLRLTRDALMRAQATARAGVSEELIAAEMRLALDCLGRIVGAIYTDDLLDRVFSRFCVGK